MRLVPVNRLTSGAKVAVDVQSSRRDDVPLLRAGVEIDDDYRRLLRDAGVYAVWIDDELGQGIEPVPILSEAARREAAAGVEVALDDARKAVDGGRPLGRHAVGELARISRIIADEVASCPDVALSVNDLAAADAYTFRHSANVAALGVLVGRRLIETRGWIDASGRRRFDRREHRLARLGLGLLLHDIGKLAVPQDVLNKPGKLSADEWEIIRAHPDAGVALLSDTVSPLVKDVVRSHHERWDGRGYPRGRSGSGISQLARVAAVVDTFDAMTSNRPYARAEPNHVAVRTVRDGAGTAFDPEVVAAFTRVVVPYPPGEEIPLPDGRMGVVVDVDPRHPHRPLVRAPVDGGFEERRLNLPEFALAS